MRIGFQSGATPPILANLAEGATTAEILEDFPTLTEADVRAAQHKRTADSW